MFVKVGQATVDHIVVSGSFDIGKQRVELLGQGVAVISTPLLIGNPVYDVHLESTESTQFIHKPKQPLIHLELNAMARGDGQLSPMVVTPERNCLGASGGATESRFFLFLGAEGRSAANPSWLPFQMNFTSAAMRPIKAVMTPPSPFSHWLSVENVGLATIVVVTSDPVSAGAEFRSPLANFA